MANIVLWKRLLFLKIKNRLSAYLKKVKAGQSILILDRDQPVARLERVERETTS